MRLDYSIKELQKLANRIRKDVLDSLYHAESGHPGGCMSMAEIMSVLFFKYMDIDPENPGWSNRDRFVLSKGHAAPVYYATLAERGYFEKSHLNTLRKIDSFLQGHPDRLKVPGVDMSTGSLGQGISAAAGMALYGKLNNKRYHVYCVIGDGEMQEGQVWEAIMSAAHFKLCNLTVLLDNNNLQIDGCVSDIMSIYPVKQKLEAFGWHVIEADGHDVSALCTSLDKAKKSSGAPQFIICKTIKGKGICYMENEVGWHGAPINEHDYQKGCAELKEYGEVG